MHYKGEGKESISDSSKLLCLSEKHFSDTRCKSGFSTLHINVSLVMNMLTVPTAMSGL